MKKRYSRCRTMDDEDDGFRMQDFSSSREPQPPDSSPCDGPAGNRNTQGKRAKLFQSSNNNSPFRAIHLRVLLHALRILDGSPPSASRNGRSLPFPPLRSGLVPKFSEVKLGIAFVPNLPNSQDSPAPSLLSTHRFPQALQEARAGIGPVPGLPLPWLQYFPDYLPTCLLPQTLHPRRASYLRILRCKHHA